MNDRTGPPKDALLLDLELAGFDWRRFVALLDTGGLDGRLLASSQQAIQGSLSAADDPPQMARLAGSALEWLAKAVVFHFDPTLLVAKSKRLQERSAAYFTGAGHPEVDSFADVGTLAAPEAVRQALTLLNITPPSVETLSQQVFAARNTSTHLNIVDASAALRAVATVMEYAVHLLKPFNLDPGTWIDEPGLQRVASVVTETIAAKPQHTRSVGGSVVPAPVVAAVRLFRAREDWDSMKARVGEEDLRRLAASPLEPLDAEGDIEQRLCPTGGHMTWFELVREDAQDDHGQSEHDKAYDLYLDHLNCPLCGLELDGSLLDEVGLGAAVGYEIVEEDGTSTVTLF